MNYNVGDIISYKIFDGSVRSNVRVTAKLADVKNGRPGFDGMAGDTPVWGYDSQIVARKIREFSGR